MAGSTGGSNLRLFKSNIGNPSRGLPTTAGDSLHHTAVAKIERGPGAHPICTVHHCPVHVLLAAYLKQI